MDLLALGERAETSPRIARVCRHELDVRIVLPRSSNSRCVALDVNPRKAIKGTQDSEAISLRSGYRSVDPCLVSLRIVIRVDP